MSETYTGGTPTAGYGEQPVYTGGTPTAGYEGQPSKRQRRRERLRDRLRAEQEARLRAEERAKRLARQQQRDAAAAERSGQGTPSAQARRASRRQSVYDALASTWEDMGLNGSEVMNALKGMPDEYANNSSKMLEVVRGTSTWQAQFGDVFKARDKNGFMPLSESDIVSMRSQYKSVLQQYVPPGFSDSNSDLDRYIANDISVDEVTSRAEKAYQFVKGRDPNALKAFKDFYGIGKKELTAYYLNPEKAFPKLERQAEIAQIGGSMRDAELQFANAKRYAGQLYGQGVTEEQAKGAFQQVAETAPAWQRVAAVEDANLSKKELTNAQLDVKGSGKARRKMKGLASRERARWGGSVGGGVSTFSQGGSSSF